MARSATTRPWARVLPVPDVNPAIRAQMQQVGPIYDFGILGFILRIPKEAP